MKTYLFPALVIIGLLSHAGLRMVAVDAFVYAPQTIVEQQMATLDQADQQLMGYGSPVADPHWRTLPVPADLVPGAAW